MPDSKPWYLSKTLWFNALTTLGSVIDTVAGTGILPPQALAAVGIANMVLRVVTTKGLAA